MKRVAGCSSKDCARAQVIAAFLFSVLVFLNPIVTQNLSLRKFHAPLTIKISKNAPPIAAIEDEEILPLQEEPIDPPHLRPKQIIIRAGVGAIDAHVFMNSTQRSKLFNITYRRFVVSKPMMIARAEVLPSRNLAGMVIEKKDPEFQREVISQYVNKQKTIEWVNTLPQNLRVRAEKLSNVTELLAADWSQPTLESRIQALDIEAPKAPADSELRHVQSGSLITPPQVPFHYGSQSGTQTVASKAVASTSPQVNQVGSPRVLRGKLEMTEGLAFVGSGQQLLVSYKVAGETRRYGDVSVQNGTYAVEVDNTSEGAIIGELRSAQGNLIGLGMIQLGSTENEPHASADIILKPTSPTVRGTVVSAYATGLRPSGLSGVSVALSKLSMGIKTVARGLFVKEGLLPNSTMIIESSKPKYWNSLSFGSNEGDVQITMFPEKMISGLANFLNEQKDYQSFGVIWGQVMVNGRPVEGAQVSLESGGKNSPIYFNGLNLPDVSRSATSSNGLFVFMRVKPGARAVKANIHGVDLPIKIIPVDAHAITKIEFNSTKKKIADTYIYDALSGTPLSASTKFTGSNKISWTDEGKLRLKFSQGADPIFLDADAGPSYMQTRITSTRNISALNFPMVPFSWLTNFSHDFDVKINQNLSIVVGFIKGANFRVFVDSADAAPETKLVYFDSKGNAVDQTNNGVLDGGFVLFNIPPGLRTIMIQPQNSREILSKVIYTDAFAASVISHRFN